MGWDDKLDIKNCDSALSYVGDPDECLECPEHAAPKQCQDDEKCDWKDGKCIALEPTGFQVIPQGIDKHKLDRDATYRKEVTTMIQNSLVHSLLDQEKPPCKDLGKMWRVLKIPVRHLQTSLTSPPFHSRERPPTALEALAEKVATTSTFNLINTYYLRLGGGVSLIKETFYPERADFFSWNAIGVVDKLSNAGMLQHIKVGDSTANQLTFVSDSTAASSRFEGPPDQVVAAVYILQGLGFNAKFIKHGQDENECLGYRNTDFPGGTCVFDNKGVEYQNEKDWLKATNPNRPKKCRSIYDYIHHELHKEKGEGFQMPTPEALAEWFVSGLEDTNLKWQNFHIVRDIMDVYTLLRMFRKFAQPAKRCIVYAGANHSEALAKLLVDTQEYVILDRQDPRRDSAEADDNLLKALKAFAEYQPTDVSVQDRTTHIETLKQNIKLAEDQHKLAEEKFQLSENSCRMWTI